MQDVLSLCFLSVYDFVFALLGPTLRTGLARCFASKFSFFFEIAKSFLKTCKQKLFTTNFFPSRWIFVFGSNNHAATSAHSMRTGTNFWKVLTANNRRRSSRDFSDETTAVTFFQKGYWVREVPIGCFGYRFALLRATAVGISIRQKKNPSLSLVFVCCFFRPANAALGTVSKSGDENNR